jgi:hypothetical protein
MAVLLLVKAISAATMVPAEFCATAETPATPPSFNESVAGLMTTFVTALLVL